MSLYYDVDTMLMTGDAVTDRVAIERLVRRRLNLASLERPALIVGVGVVRPV